MESIVTSCLESNDQELIDHLFQDCKFLDKLLAADENPYAPDSHAEVKIAIQLIHILCKQIATLLHFLDLKKKLVL